MLVFISLMIIGIASYWLLLSIANTVLSLELSLVKISVAFFLGTLVAIFIYKMHGNIHVMVGKIFRRQSYDYYQKLSEYVDKIHSVFNLREQSRSLLILITEVLGCKQACLLFLEDGGEDYIALLGEPDSEDNPLLSLRFNGEDPIVEYIKREQKLIARDSMANLPELHNLWHTGKIGINGAEILVPLISRDRLIGILVLGERQSGNYSLEDFRLLESVANRVAVSMEKEYLREQLSKREEELSAINRASAIITSSLVTHEVFDSFVDELRMVVDVSWASIVLTDANAHYILALSSEAGIAWKVEDQWPIKGTAIEWTVTHKKTIVESDLSQKSSFIVPDPFLKQQVQSIAYLPLIAKGRAIGNLIVASRRPHAYNRRHIILLERLVSQIAMPIENTQVFAEAEEKARIDELTGLLNRRSLNEVITSEIKRYSRYGGVFSLIILDLDSFKAFNDNHGHLVGDTLLREIGSIVKTTIRSSDQAFRYGGDEFAVLLPNTPVDDAYQVAERVRKEIASMVIVGYNPVTASLGLAGWPVDGIEANEVIAVADAALYHAKRNGGNKSYSSSLTIRHQPATGTVN